MSFKNFNFIFSKNGLKEYDRFFDFFSDHKYTLMSRKNFIEYSQLLFDKNPFGKGLQVILENNKNEIIGYNSIFSVPYVFNKIDIKGGQNVNLLVKKDYRKKGLFIDMSKLLYKQAFQDGYKFIYGFPNQNSYKGLIKELGCSFRPLSYFQKKLSKNDVFSLENEYRLIKNFEKIDQKDLESEGFSFYIKKNKEYLKWRYLDIGKFYRYEIFKIINSNGTTKGIIIINIHEEEGRKYGQILDIVINFRNLSLFKDVINFYHNYFVDNNIKNLSFFLFSSDDIVRTLKKKGFCINTKDRFFIYKVKLLNIHEAINQNDFLLFLSAKDNM